MKKINLIYILIAFLTISTSTLAQDKDTGVYLSVSLDKDSDYLPGQSQNYLLNKMKQIVSANGISADGGLSQFTLECNLIASDKNIVSGAPAKVAETVEFTFYIKDIVGQKSFGNISIASKGVGDNENKAMISAIKNISPSNKNLQKFLEDGAKKIVDYYNTNADQIIRSAKMLANTKQYDQALFMLCVIPQAFGEKYELALETAEQIYKDYVNNKANENFAKAQSIWASGRDARAAELAAEYLGEITPDASCYAESLKLMRDMGVVLDKDKEYKQKMEAQEKAREHESTMSSIEAMKQIALSYQARELQRGKIIL